MKMSSSQIMKLMNIEITALLILFPWMAATHLACLEALKITTSYSPSS